MCRAACMAHPSLFAGRIKELDSNKSATLDCTRTTKKRTNILRIALESQLHKGRALLNADLAN